MNGLEDTAIYRFYKKERKKDKHKNEGSTNVDFNICRTNVDWTNVNLNVSQKNVTVALTSSVLTSMRTNVDAHLCGSYKTRDTIFMLKKRTIILGEVLWH